MAADAEVGTRSCVDVSVNESDVLWVRSETTEEVLRDCLRKLRLSDTV